MKHIILSLLLGIVKAKTTNDIHFQCPHSPRQDTGFSYSQLDLPVTTVLSAKSMTIESSCPFELYQTRKTIFDVTIIGWQKKTSTTTGTNAAATTYEISESEDKLVGLCILPPGIPNKLLYGRKALTCIELSCNQTACLPVLHILVPQQVCISVRSCLLTWGEIKINLYFERTFCPNGLIVAGECFQPFYGSVAQLQSLDIMQISVTCFLIVETAQTTKVSEFLEQTAKATSCSTNDFYSSYVCFLAGYSLYITVPHMGDQLSLDIASAMILNPYGEDHDRPGHGEGTFRVAGELDAKVPSTGTDSIKGIALSGQILYTSIFILPKKVSAKVHNVLTKGYLPKVNHSVCDNKVLPLIWKGLVHVPGHIERLEPCKVFCTLSGPGASCEAFSSTGIFNISSPTCLIGKLHKYKELEDHITFVCQRIDSDIVIYCNGQRKVIKTKTLVIGQCIYSITSFFSLLPSIAHSLAVEVCVQGFHGWASLCLIITFCFGWILIPSLTWLTLQIIRGIMILMNKHTGESRIKFILEKIKSEFHNTVGNTTCGICTKECSCSEELKAHNEFCPSGNCPYCMKDLHPSSHVLTEHFKQCPLIDRYVSKVKDALKVPNQTTMCYRRLGTFRYKNRCYILIVWLIMLTIEILCWAASAQQIEVKPEWQDTAHGVGYIPLNLDYEIDFSLASGSSYVHKRVLVDPSDENKKVPFTVHISSQQIVASVQYLGHWMDGEVNVKSVFHCYGECKKYTYPWQFASCQSEIDYQYETSWGCNPADCPGVGTGCTACGIFLDKLTPKASVYKIVNLKYMRTVSYQVGTEQQTKEIDTNDCLSSNHAKVCMIGTVSNIQIGDTLVFFGPIAGGAVLVRQWCASNCQLGDPGDIMIMNADLKCPDFSGTMHKRCQFATEPLCYYQGNLLSGYKKMHQTIDSFISLNMSDPKLIANNLMWSDPDGIYKDHVNIVVNKELPFEDLAENPCVVDLSVSSIEGSWGSGVGFRLTCLVSLTECTSFLTTIKACDKAMCYGGKVASLSRGQNTIIVQGRGGHSGSSFKCCHDHSCSKNAKKASAPHLERVSGENTKLSEIFSDGAPECGILCRMEKIGEWLGGLFRGNWWVLLVLVGITILSILLLSMLCPAHRK
ncbi:glycoprotein [Laibin virus]|uniref:Envelopment polyprotein n=1 Tax=Laibin virus TaxID=1633187 RepID=A0A384VY39_9VIRU|nr:glycoprotein [Laibin virus]